MYDENPEEIDRRAMMAQMKTGGVATPRGGTAVVTPPLEAPATEPPVAAEKPSYGKTVGQYGNRLEGFDAGKLSSEHASPKYQIGRTLSNFDPTKGVTPEVLDALNTLGIGTFSGKGDRLTVGGNVDPRFEGYTNIDVVRDLGQGGWQYGAENPNAPQAPQGAPGMMGMSGPSSFQGIQSLMPTDTNYYNTLQAKLQEILGGAPALDRNALIAQMSR